jgi:nucleoside phosphorylase
VWQQLLRNWLRQQAAGHLRRAAANAARSKPAPEASEADSRATQRCHVGLVFADRSEAGSLEDRLQGAFTTRAAFSMIEGGLGGRRVVVVCASAKSAADATRALIIGHSPTWIIAAGFCTALQATLRRGDVVMASSVGEPGGRQLSIDVKLQDSKTEKPHGVRTGRLLTTDRDVDQPAIRRELGSQHDALAADTTSLAVAETCRDQQVRCLAIKIVRHAIDDRAMPESKLIKRQASLAGRLGAATGALVRRPGSAKDFLMEKQDTLSLADRLAEFLQKVVREI